MLIKQRERFTPDYSEILQNTKDLKEELKSFIKKLSDAFKKGVCTDKVKLGAPGWKQRYYKEKFSVETPEALERQRKAVVEKYTEGLCWVLLYYYSGVASWNWFYPFHYGPFASDFKGVAQTNVRFIKSSPFKPFDQLLGVLPPKSAHALPIPYQVLMTDEESSIIDFYPTGFEIDVDGKRFQWQGVCKLDFIEEKRLLDETKKLELELNEEEAKRNAQTDDHLFMGFSSELGSRITSLRKEGALIDTSVSGEINGFVRELDDEICVDNGNVICVYYKPPPLTLLIPHLLGGVEIPEKSVTESDIMETPLWHEYQGSWPGSRIPNYQVDRSYNSTVTKSSFEEVNKCAGVGWASRGHYVPPNFRVENKHEHTRVPAESLESTSSRGKTSYPWKTTCYGRGEVRGYDQGQVRGFEDLRISRFRSDGNAQQGESSFGQSNGRGQQRDYSFRQPYGRSPTARSPTTYSGSSSDQDWRLQSLVQSTASSYQAVLGRPVGTNQRHYNQDRAAGFQTSTASSSCQAVPGRPVGSNQRYYNQDRASGFQTSTFARGRGRYGLHTQSGFEAFQMIDIAVGNLPVGMVKVSGDQDDLLHYTGKDFW